jgi:hypothetical protein
MLIIQFAGVQNFQKSQSKKLAWHTNSRDFSVDVGQM